VGRGNHSQARLVDKGEGETERGEREEESEERGVEREERAGNAFFPTQDSFHL
jgi:hypothetical protein